MFGYGGGGMRDGLVSAFGRFDKVEAHEVEGNSTSCARCGTEFGGGGGGGVSTMWISPGELQGVEAGVLSSQNSSSSVHYSRCSARQFEFGKVRSYRG